MRNIKIERYFSKQDCYKAAMQKYSFETNDNEPFAIYGNWTLSDFQLSEPIKKQNLLIIPGKSEDNVIDLSNGDKFENRTLKITLESSVGNYEKRERNIRLIQRDLISGYSIIQPPDYDANSFDDLDTFIYGRILTVEKNFSDLIHSRITITADVEPFMKKLTVYNVRANESVLFRNSGVKTGVPFIVSDEDLILTVSSNGVTQEVSYNSLKRGTSLLHKFPVYSQTTKALTFSAACTVGFFKEVL